MSSEDPKDTVDDPMAAWAEALEEQKVADKPADGWVKVRHRDGASGFVRINQVWGL